MNKKIFLVRNISPYQIYEGFCFEDLHKESEIVVNIICTENASDGSGFVFSPIRLTVNKNNRYIFDTYKEALRCQDTLRANDGEGLLYSLSWNKDEPLKQKIKQLIDEFEAHYKYNIQVLPSGAQVPDYEQRCFGLDNLIKDIKQLLRHESDKLSESNISGEHSYKDIEPPPRIKAYIEDYVARCNAQLNMYRQQVEIDKKVSSRINMAKDMLVEPKSDKPSEIKTVFSELLDSIEDAANREVFAIRNYCQYHNGDPISANIEMDFYARITNLIHKVKQSFNKNEGK